MPSRGHSFDWFDLRAVTILVPSLLATLAAWWSVYSQGLELRQARFQAVAEETLAEIAGRMAVYEEALLSARAFMDSSQEVTRAEWSSFVGGLNILHRSPGIQGIGFAQRVRQGQEEGHELAQRQNGIPDYRITPPGPRSIYFPVVYLEPSQGSNQKAFGFDMFSEPVRHAAMVRARDSDRPAMSGRVTLVQETGESVQAGALLYVPVYAQGAPVALVGQRRDAILGFVYAPFRIDDLFNAVLGPRRRDLCVAVADVDRADGYLFESTGCTPGAFVTTKVLDIYGRNWSVRINSTPRLDRETGNDLLALVVLVAGIAISLLLVVATQSMVAERRRREALSEANQDLAVVNRDLDAARRQADTANAAKSRFLAAASHDLRQPMQTLGIYLHLLSESTPPAHKPVAAEALRAFDTTQRMLSSLLDIAALESGNQQMQRQGVDMAALLTALAGQIRPLAAARGLEVRLRTCPVQVETDPVMMERMLRNLMDNALKYTAKGAVLLACRQGRDGGLRVKVADSGPGIPPDKRDLIFEDFYQVANPERDRSKGLGLGLATVSRTARLLGYRLELYSRLGKGSSFVVVIPR